MKWLLLTFTLALQASGIACSQVQRAQTKVQRQPLEKQQREYRTPTNYEPRDKGYDPKTGKESTYDHKPRVELVDAKAGKYAFKWIGLDGEEKTVIFQRADAIDVIVSATVSETAEGPYRYSYEVQNLPPSGTFLKRFVVQNFASDVQPDKTGEMFVGEMSNAIHIFREGHWISFADISDDFQIDPGQAVKVQLTSSAPPGLVGCNVAGGESTLKGAGEHMPSALESLLPGYEEWPKGYTVGPVDKLKTFSKFEQTKYLLDNLPQFHKLGWMTDEAFSQYEQHLKSGDLGLEIKQIYQLVAGKVDSPDESLHT